MIRIALVILGALVILIAIVTIIGYSLPKAHVASRDRTLAATPERLFATLQEVEKFPQWRSDVKSVEVLARTPALRWREHGSNGAMTFEVQDVRPPMRLVGRIADTSLAFGGSWTYAFQPEGTGTRLSITENGEVYNPIFRFMSRFVFGHTATIDRYLADLDAYVRAS
jgi:Polyketide cyclase / dehydrase and lipid transport